MAKCDNVVIKKGRKVSILPVKLGTQGTIRGPICRYEANRNDKSSASSSVHLRPYMGLNPTILSTIPWDTTRTLHGVYALPAIDVVKSLMTLLVVKHRPGFTQPHSSH